MRSGEDDIKEKVNDDGDDDDTLEALQDWAGW